jgi:hypothetical protein
MVLRLFKCNYTKYGNPMQISFKFILGLGGKGYTEMKRERWSKKLKEFREPLSVKREL